MQAQSPNTMRQGGFNRLESVIELASILRVYLLNVRSIRPSLQKLLASCNSDSTASAAVRAQLKELLHTALRIVDEGGSDELLQRVDQLTVDTVKLQRDERAEACKIAHINGAKQEQEKAAAATAAAAAAATAVAATAATAARSRAPISFKPPVIGTTAAQRLQRDIQHAANTAPRGPGAASAPATPSPKAAPAQAAKEEPAEPAAPAAKTAETPAPPAQPAQSAKSEANSAASNSSSSSGESSSESGGSESGEDDKADKADGGQPSQPVATANISSAAVLDAKITQVLNALGTLSQKVVAIETEQKADNERRKKASAAARASREMKRAAQGAEQPVAKRGKGDLPNTVDSLIGRP